MRDEKIRNKQNKFLRKREVNFSYTKLLRNSILSRMCCRNRKLKISRTKFKEQCQDRIDVNDSINIFVQCV